MEPELVPRDDLQSVLAELSAREPLFHRPEFGTTRADYEAMMAAEFWEIGASGRRYSRAYVLEVLENRAHDPQAEHWQTSDFHCLQVAPHNFLLTYTLQQPDRLTRRASLWRKTDAGWQIVFHQGTVVGSPA